MGEPTISRGTNTSSPGGERQVSGDQHESPDDVAALERAQGFRHGVERHRPRHDGSELTVLVQLEDVAVRGIDGRPVVPGVLGPMDTA